MDRCPLGYAVANRLGVQIKVFARVDLGHTISHLCEQQPNAHTSKGPPTMFPTLTPKQAHKARLALWDALRIADHVQSRRSPIDGWAFVDVFVGRTYHSVTLGPRGGLRSKTTGKVE